MLRRSLYRYAMPLNVHCIVHAPTSTCSYIVSDEKTKETAIIDSALDYNAASGFYHTTHADKLIKYVEDQKLVPKYLLETHVHADHISAAEYMKSKWQSHNVPNCIGNHIDQVQAVFSKLFNMKNMKNDGSQFDILIKDEDELKLGDMSIHALYTPGHTPVCTSYKIGDSIFTGDTLFMPDIGTARCDFPGGSTSDMYDSCTKLLSYPEETKIYVGHDYPGTRREFRYETTVGEQKRDNKMMKDGITKEEYIILRGKRDAGLGAPNLLLPSLQCNIRAGKFPDPEDNAVSYLKIPVKQIDFAATQAEKEKAIAEFERQHRDYHDHTPAENQSKM